MADRKIQDILARRGLYDASRRGGPGIAGLGLSQGHISHHVLVALILMTIGAALMGPLLMAPLARSLSIPN